MRPFSSRSVKPLVRAIVECLEWTVVPTIHLYPNALPTDSSYFAYEDGSWCTTHEKGGVLERLWIEWDWGRGL